MRRRSLLAATLGSTALGAASAAAFGQQKPMPVVGFLGATSPDALQASLVAFHQGLAEMGYVDGKNTTIDYRWAREHYDRLPAMAVELVKRDVTAFVAATLPAALAAKTATTTKPVVFFSGGDPVEQGLVASLNRPGGNLTGACVFINDLGPKQLELLHEAMPGASAIGFLTNPGNPNAGRQLQGMEDAAQAIGKRIIALQARSASELDSAIAVLVQQRGEALIVAADPFLGTQYERIVALASRHRIAVVSARLSADAGGLFGYGNKVEDAYREVGIYTGRVLKGARPADLPVVRAAKFTLAINLKTARSLGIAIPAAVLARADELIE